MTSDGAPTERAHLVGFAISWLPYGGGSAEDIFLEFGLTEHAYFERLLTLLKDGDLRVSEAARHGLGSVCVRRLRATRL